MVNYFIKTVNFICQGFNFICSRLKILVVLTIDARDGFFLLLCEFFPLRDKTIDLIILILDDRLEFSDISRLTKVEFEKKNVKSERRDCNSCNFIVNNKVKKFHNGTLH